jgi:hypothetical protein
MPGNSNRAAADTSGSCQRSPSRTTPPATRPCPLRRRAKKALRWVRNPTQGPSLRPWEENVGVGIILANALGRRGDGRHIPNKRAAKGAPLYVALRSRKLSKQKAPRSLSPRHGLSAQLRLTIADYAGASTAPACFANPLESIARASARGPRPASLIILIEMCGDWRHERT